MANESSTGFGLRPLRKVGQTDNNAGLGEWDKGASTTLISHQDVCVLAATGKVAISTASAAVLNNLGSLNGAFYTDPNTSKPTWSQYAPNNTATDMTCLVNDDPQQMFEMRTALTSMTVADAGATAPLVSPGGSGSPNFLSGMTIGTPTTVVNQLKVLGLTRDPNNQTVDEAGSVWRVMISNHILGNGVVGI